jgi:predicted NUDIX family phosphoesterase
LTVAQAAGERVLVLPREDVPGGCDFRGVRRCTPADLEALRGAVRRHGRFIERAAAEVDPSQKQLIPYVVVRDGRRVFVMRRTRAGGDERLHDRVSIGVGGHLNEVDRGDDPLEAGVLREWSEELDTDWIPEFRLVGLLNDDGNAVGAVHLGVVFEVDAAGRAVDVRERDKLSGRFLAWEELAAMRDNLETWSQLVADTYT